MFGGLPGEVVVCVCVYVCACVWGRYCHLEDHHTPPHTTAMHPRACWVSSEISMDYILVFLISMKDKDSDIQVACASCLPLWLKVVDIMHGASRWELMPLLTSVLSPES